MTNETPESLQITGDASEEPSITAENSVTSPTESNPDIDVPPASIVACSSPKNTKKEQALLKRRYIIQELVDTERDYVKDLGLIVSDYKETVTAGPVPDGLSGKERVVFGNIEQIYEWHRDTFLPAIEKCIETAAENATKDSGALIAAVFNRYEKRLYMYTKYCENKPKADYLVADFFDYFEELRLKFGHKLNVADLLIKPVQRIMKYQLLIKDIMKQSERGEVDTKELKGAVQVMQEIPKSCNDMMFVGRLQGFDQPATARGKLLLQDRLFVQEPDSNKFNDRQVFLFEQILIISEAFERKAKVAIAALTNADYIYKAHVRTNRMSMKTDDSDPLRFFINDRSVQPEIRYIFQTQSQEASQQWINEVHKMLQMQEDWCRMLSDPKGTNSAKAKPALPVRTNLGVELDLSKQKSSPAAPTSSIPLKTTHDESKDKEKKKKMGFLDNFKIGPFKKSSKNKTKLSTDNADSSSNSIKATIVDLPAELVVNAGDSAAVSCKVIYFFCDINSGCYG